MVRVPVPSLPSTLPAVEVVSSVRRGAPLVVLVAPGEAPEPDTADTTAGVRLLDGSPLPDEWLPAALATGKAGEVHPLRGTPRWLLGVGADTADSPAWRRVGAALVRAVNSDIGARDDAGERPPRSVQLELPADVAPECVAGMVLGACLGGYRHKVTEAAAAKTVRSLRLVVPEARLAEVEATVREATELARATALARDLANTPSNVKDPDWLARTIVRVTGDAPRLEVTVRDAEWLSEAGFGGVLAVGGGSASPPRLIEMRHRPRGASTHLLLVGKGITFDTGGISIKPAAGMHLMRTDMSGAAAVVGAMRAIARLRLGVKVTALLPAAENHVSGSAYRPGDVVTHYGGTTTEITNTDAEGRIVLADALAYGVRRFAPDVVVDVATLTGAMKVALGLRTGGVFASEDELAQRLCAAGNRVGEAWWQMPLLPAHQDAVTSEIADLRQCPPGPGGITAAMYLREFADGVPWAHLDIAGPARAEQPYDDVAPGGTGFAARTLVEFADSYVR
ncbi:MAG: leucyl aminopeptidase [Actinophytocola sp.]|nr:leucyl aminopeptidase [Actinophytocola sp.]